MSWADSADRHGIPHEEALYAMSHATCVVEAFGRPRAGSDTPTLFIGPSRFGTLEVLAVVSPPAQVRIFHVMRLRESTRLAAGYKED